MDIKTINNIIKLNGLLGMLFLLTACPSETFCDKNDTSTTIPDKIIIDPDKNKIRAGQTLKLTINIPAKVKLSENDSINIFEKLGVSASNKIFNISPLTEGNSFKILKGQLKNSAVLLKYYEESNAYKFDCEITLNRKGNYKITGNFIQISFTEDREECKFLDITTNIKSSNKEGFYEFIVE